MADIKGIFRRLGVKFMYLLALTLVFLVPVFYMMFKSGIIETIGKKIPIKEGTFVEADGEIKIKRPESR
ncbi:MAG: hypothetical protein MUD12_16275 [Spirochaetes bacterium]|jgi:hypothetical protein|nr:hypothetical protein [Spirochaetota bacterium]